MAQHKPPSRSFVTSSIIALILFYGFLFVISKWFLTWTGRSFRNEWVVVFISALPILIVLALFLSNKLSEAKVGSGGIELKFSSELPPSALESIELDSQVARDYLLKGSRRELDALLENLGQRLSLPTLLLIPLEDLNIDFRILRQYIYKLSDVAPIQYIVFVGRQQRYLGYTTLEKFKARYPRFGIEILLEDLENERVQQADLPPLFSTNLRSDWIDEYLDRLIYGQWNINRRRGRDNQGPGRVRVADLSRLGASDVKVLASSSPANVYWFLLENDLTGVPAVNNDGTFIGIVTKDRITQVVILQLLQKSKKAEPKA